MEGVAVLLVSFFAVLGSVYCLWITFAAWKESRTACLQRLNAGQGSATRGRALKDAFAASVEAGLAAAFVIGAISVVLGTARTQGTPWWPTSETNVRCENCLAERFFQGPNDSRLVIHFANSVQNRPVVFVDTTSQPIRDRDIAEIAQQFPEARDLLLGRTQLTDAGLPELQHFKYLDSLSLQGLPITDRGLKHLASHRDLSFLDLSATNISDRGLKSLASLARLEELRLCGTRVSDAGLTHLYRHPNLKLLALTDTAVTSQGIAEVRQALPMCTIEHKSLPQARRGCSLARK